VKDNSLMEVKGGIKPKSCLKNACTRSPTNQAPGDAGVRILLMKKSLLIAIFLLYSGFVNAEVLDFEFMDNSGRTFRSTMLLAQLEQRYNYRYENMSILLIETPSLSDGNYLRQNEILKSLGHGEAEELQLMYVTSCWTEEYLHGYHTSIKTAESLAGTNKGFRLTLIDVNGKSYFRKSSPISLETLRKVLKEKRK